MGARRIPLQPWVIAVAVTAACLRPPASATNYTITVTADGVSTNGNCTLREAIRAATTDTAVDACPAGGATDTIVLAASEPYAFVLGEEVISGVEIAIEGATLSAASYVIELGGNSRFLRAEAGSKLALSRLTLRNGNSLATADPEGGCLRVTASNLTLRDAVIAGCLATRGGGLWFNSTGASQGVIERVSFLGNEARATEASPIPDGGGAVASLTGPSEITVSDSLFQENRAVSELAGGLAAGSGLKVFTGHAGAEVIIRRTRLLGNEERSDLGGQGALVLSLADAEEAVVEDLLIADNTWLGGATSTWPVGLSISAGGTANVWVARLRLGGNAAVDDTETQALIELQGSAFLELTSVLVAGGADRGLGVRILGDSTLRAGHLTVNGHAEQGLALTNFSTGPLRLENSLLWGNGPAGGNDLETTGTVDADRVTNHNWIGSLGDPDPQLADPVNGDYDPQPGSPLVDAGDRTFVTVGSGDALGRSRVVGGETDVGALEEPGLLFADGFESADTDAWSQVVP